MRVLQRPVYASTATRPQVLRAHPITLTSARRAAQDTTKVETNVLQKFVLAPMVILPQTLHAHLMMLPSVLLATQGISRMEMTAHLALPPHINP